MTILQSTQVTQLLQLGIASAALAVLIWGYRLYRQSADASAQRLPDRLLVILGLAAALAYPNFGKFHFDNFVHNWDTYHYYMGAKYFRELGYVGLYDCAVVAESEQAQTPRQAARIGARAIMDLRTNAPKKASEVLKDPQTCKANFADERWQQFKETSSSSSGGCFRAAGPRCTRTTASTARRYGCCWAACLPTPAPRRWSA